jgi:hypothetical protein
MPAFKLLDHQHAAIAHIHRTHVASWATMIGIALDSADLPVAREFFELFKTPWEPVVAGKKYDAVISAGGEYPDVDANRLVVYSSRVEDIDRELGVRVDRVTGPLDVMWDDTTFPVYGQVATFCAPSASRLTAGGRSLDCRGRVGNRSVRRIGYDLFAEVRHLLTAGQPVSKASTPTLELHIALLRQALVESGVPFVEIPPRPYGYQFTCCLTHDIDFYGIRRHAFDRTLAGFVARASIGTLIDVVRGRRSMLEAARNWLSLLSLPLVLLRLAPDFWRPFEDYARFDGRKSTFFLVPFKGRPGVSPDGTVDNARAVPYQASDVQQAAKDAAKRGSELAVHGIDAWRDTEAGRAEMTELTSLTGFASAGVRMHWLYFSADSPQCLEAAGFDYDSTWGYNENVGYRAGTSQVFRLPDSQDLMELPLSIMDSALLFRGRMGLNPAEALDRCQAIVDNAKRFGGTLVVNWHDRSLAPERLWDRVYVRLLKAIGADDVVWFATAQEAVDWFRWRRSIRFCEDGTVTACDRKASNGRAVVPPAVVRVHRPDSSGEVRFEEFRIVGGESVAVSL